MRVILWPRPTMMPDRIGIIGNTQGVSASKRPAPKKNDTTSQKPPCLSTAAICELSVAGAIAGAGEFWMTGTVAAGGVSADTIRAGAVMALAAGAASGRSSVTALLIGG